MSECFEISKGTNSLAPGALSQELQIWVLINFFLEPKVEERLDEKIDTDRTRIEEVDQVAPNK